MEVNFSAQSPAEMRVLSKFISDLADLRDPPTGEATKTPFGASAPKEAEPQPEATKRANRKKAEPVVEPVAPAPEASAPSTPQGSDKPLTAAEAAEALRGHANKEGETAPGESQPAATVTEVGGSTQTQNSAPAAAEEPKKATHDDLRQLMGQISQVSMTHRTAAIALVRSTAGCNGIGDIKAELLDSIHAGFLAILEEAKAHAATNGANPA